MPGIGSARARRHDETLPHSTHATVRWLGALDALAPYLIVTAAIAIARHAFASPFPGAAAVVLAVAALGIGAAAGFFWQMPASHRTWPVAFVLSVVVTPLLALHASLESVALGEPAAIQIALLAFTWTALFVVVCLIIGVVYTTAAAQPGWAGVVVSPLALMLGTIPVLSLSPSRPSVLTALLSLFALAEIASGVAWLIPERRRWYVVPVLFALAAAVIGHEVVTTPHHLPGRVLLLVDAGLALLTSAVTLAAPVLCRWLASIGSGRTKGRPLTATPKKT